MNGLAEIRRMSRVATTRPVHVPLLPKLYTDAVEAVLNAHNATQAATPGTERHECCARYLTEIDRLTVIHKFVGHTV